MIHDPQHTLTKVTLTGTYSLSLSFADGAAYTVDLAEWITHNPSLVALSDIGLFNTARLDARGGYIVWIDDELELAADNLRNLAIEQAGGIGHERLFNWLHQHDLNQQQASDALGISRRMLNYYLSGSKPIPKTVWLACLGWESLQRLAA